MLSRSTGLLARGLNWLMRSRRNRKRFFLYTAGAAVLIVVVAELSFAPRHLPWRPLAIDERAGFSTDIKLAAISLGPQSWCERLLDRSTVLQTSVLPAQQGSGSCGWSAAFDFKASDDVTLTGQSPTAMRCPLAAGAHIWLTSADYRARTLLGSGLARVHHVGTYSCRRMYNRSGGPMSQHAYANAWDVVGFELDDGRVVSVLKHWRAGGELQSFLRAVRDDACNIFSIVLGPDYNEAHRDHLHVDMGRGSRCS